ncbi:MAG: Gfo/Idh/MocA family oxidoreductase [Gemmiger sp.]|nr:Gfo/Idh/MocA family oxidoreductase [Gemmiger sp.]
MFKVAILGCGRIAMERHAPECAAHPSVEIAGFFDRVPAHAAALCGQYGGRAYNSLAEVLADGTVDAVIVCTANATHVPYSLAALQAGKHVLCEKPMALTLAEAAELAVAAKASGKLFMVAQNQRFDPVNQRAKALLAAGSIGNVLRFTAEFSHGGPEGWSVDGGRSMYFRKEESGRGAIMDLGIHKIDLMRWLLGEEFTEVSARLLTLDKKDAAGQPLPLDDNALLTVRTAGGQLGTITASWTNYGGCDSTVCLYGTAGVMEVWDTNNAAPRIHLRKRGGAVEQYTFPPAQGSGLIQAFTDAVLEGSASPVSALEGARGIQIVEAACTAAQSGHTEPVTPWSLP